jgi:hypothetical protein
MADFSPMGGKRAIDCLIQEMMKFIEISLPQEEILRQLLSKELKSSGLAP